MEEDKKLPHHELTGAIPNCCFEVMKELGPGFLERVLNIPKIYRSYRFIVPSMTESLPYIGDHSQISLSLLAFFLFPFNMYT